MAHRRAKLTPFGSLLVVQRVEEMGWTVARAAEAVGVSRPTAGKWLRRYRGEGLAGLEDRPSRPLRSPHALPLEEVQCILQARHHLRVGPHRLAPAPGWPTWRPYLMRRETPLPGSSWRQRPPLPARESGSSASSRTAPLPTPTPAPSLRPSRLWGPATWAPAPTGPRPTARPSASSRPSSMSGLTPDFTAPTRNAYTLSQGGWSSIIIADPTPRWEASLPGRLL